MQPESDNTFLQRMKKEYKDYIGKESREFSITFKEDWFQDKTHKMVVTCEPQKNRAWWRKVLSFFGITRLDTWEYTVKPHIPPTDN